jgi:hypothetical protein
MTYQYENRLAIPNVNSKISDSISGSTLLTNYTLEIENGDGKYDDVESLDWFNTVLTLKRTDKNNPILEDFKTILMGEISYPVVNEKSVKLVVNNVFRALTQRVCNTFNIIDYPNVFDNVKDKDIPIGYGDLLNVPVFRVDPSEYIAIDKDYITAVTTVYDKDGNSISFTFNPVDGQINAIDAVSADVTGRTNNRIGTIITTEIQEKALITYNSDNWDTTETNEFIANDSFINFYFDGGTVRDLVNKALKNDNAFMFTKNDGFLTLRQWGRTYKKHEIASWKTTKFPKKDYKDAQKYFNSSVSLSFQKDIKNNIYDNNRIIGDDTLFDKVKRSSYNVDLYTNGDLESLGLRLMQRFGELSEIIPFYSGQDTSEINLLDLIILDVNINGRQFSTKTEWIVREVNPGQDVLMLEARSGFEEPGVIDGVLSQPMFNMIDGILSQPMHEEIDGVLSQPLVVIE